MRIKTFLKINILRTLYLNFKYYPVRTAFKFLVILFGRFSIHNLKGSIRINGNVFPGMVKIGKLHVGTFDKQMKSVLNLCGTIEFNGFCELGKGISLSVGPNSKLSFGANF